MIPKIKRIRRKKLQTGGTARKFENIPTASQPVQDTGLGTRNQLVDKFVQEQIKTPEVASAAQQSYTPQAVQTNELLTGSTMADPTSVGTTTISYKACASESSAISIYFIPQSPNLSIHSTSLAEFHPALNCTTHISSLHGDF